AGAGRVMVLATDGSWRWSLPAAGRTGSARTYERFWDDALRWLVRDERSALLVLEADRRAVGPNESVEVRARVRTRDYQPRAGVGVKFLVKDGAGAVVREESVSTAQDGVARPSLE